MAVTVTYPIDDDITVGDTLHVEHHEILATAVNDHQDRISSLEAGGPGGGGDPDLSDYYTKEQADALLAGKVADGDSRLSNTRDPNHHAATHQTGGADEIDLTALGAVPATRKVGGVALNADVTLTKTMVGLANADNTADADKPISDDVQAALDDKLDADKAGAASGVATLDSSSHAKFVEAIPGSLFFLREGAPGSIPDRPTTRTDVAFLFISTTTPFVGSTKAIDGVDLWLQIT